MDWSLEKRAPDDGYARQYSFHLDFCECGITQMRFRMVPFSSPPPDITSASVSVFGKHEWISKTAPIDKRRFGFVLLLLIDSDEKGC